MKDSSACPLCGASLAQGILQQQQRDALLKQWQEEARVKVDAWEEEHKHPGGASGEAAGEKEIPKTQDQE